MKINWGTGIVIAIVGFISFIMYFVISMSTDKKFSHDLVTDSYYEKELNYQNDIDAIKNAKQLAEDVRVEKSEEGLKIFIPKSLQSNGKGKVFLYRPSNKQLDFEIPFSNSNNYLLVPENRLLDGRWNITVEIENKETKYRFVKEITY